MSTYDDYDDEPRRYRNVRTRPRERDEPDYVREETYIERGKGSGPRGAELVYRGREDSTEDIPRDFPPPGRDNRRSGYRDNDDYDAPRRSKSAGGRRYSDDYDDDRRSGYTEPAAAGAAGYAAGRRRGERDNRRSRDDRDYDSDRSSPRRDRRKSGVGDTLEGLGLGGLLGGLIGGKDKDRSRSRSRAGTRRDYSSSGSDRTRGGDKKKTERKWAQAAQAALVAGAVEAFISRKAPGPWTGDKGKRIATAALGAGGIDGLIDRNPDKKTKRHLAEAVLGGLAANRLANGAPDDRSKSRGRGYDSRDQSPDSRAPRSRSRSIIDRFRGRSQSRGVYSDDSRGTRGTRGGGDGGGGTSGAIKGALAAGGVAAAGKAIYDRVRSKSRKRRSPSNSSADSYVPSRNRRRDNRRSPRSDTGDSRQNDQGTSREVGPAGRSEGASTIAAGGGDSREMTRRNRNDDNENQGSQRGGEGGKKGGGGKNDGELSASSSTTEMEKKRKSMKGKELITAGLATVATIHAAHGLYSSMESHEKRHQLVAEGEMTPQEARKKQTKAWIQDAAAVGIAALGIKGAFSEWKEMKEQRNEIQELEQRKGQRRKKRLARERQEEHERHERMMKIMEQNPQLAMGYQLNQSGYPMLGSGQMPPGMANGAPPADLSGNPYAPRNSGR